MTTPGARVSDLTPEELELLALDHVEGMFVELDATRAAVREQCHPLKLIKRHPFIAAGLAAGAAFLLVRLFRRKPAGNSSEKAASDPPGFFDSLFSGAAGAAGRALPGLLASWLTHRSEQD